MDETHTNQTEPNQAAPEQTETPPPVPPAQKPKKLLIAVIIVAVVLIGGGVYAWQAANNRTTQDNKTGKTAASSEESDQSPIEDGEESAGTTPTPSPETPTPSAAAATSSLTVTSAKIVPTSKYVSETLEYPNFVEYKFTIKNNSDAIHTYSLQMIDGYINGISKTGEVIKPVVPDITKVWTMANIPAGGSEQGYALFYEPHNIAKLQWKSPDATGTVEVTIPAVQN